ncbi:hypothetical protein D7030_11785 [Flavobacteriaceae bacterium AU392]|nr:hypothetical protein D1817_12885 [Flavobacteriaceae bacterium]RKM82832.1 hypothetical protein D7030_11785 [Flavobacteriaceae bacterium AU392]
MLKLYTNTSFLTEEHRKKVFPLLFDLYYLKNEILFEYYKIVNVVSECDFIVFPIDYVAFLKFKTDFLTLQELAKKYNKPIWIYSAGDYGFTNYIKNSYTFRLGGYKSKLNDSTFIMPSFINDPYKTQLSQRFSTKQKEEKPDIGFVGHAQSGILKYFKELLNHLKYQIKRKTNKLVADSQSFYPSSIKRAYYLKKLNLNKNLNTNFILRENYRAGILTETDKYKTTKEFYDNVFNNAYTFCMRGVGNFSIRLYETLAVGRIPILLNTDCKLPLSNIIKWSQHCVILEETKEKSIESQILEFHNSNTEETFNTIQNNNRQLWENYLVRHAYFIKVHDILKQND